MNRLSAWFSELAPRERRLISLFGAVCALLVCVLVPIGVNASLQSRRDANAELRDTVMRLQAGKAAVKARQQRRDQIASKYAKRAPKLGGFLEQIAKDNKIEIPDQQDKPELPIGKRYIERSSQLHLRKVPGLPLLRFLEKIETSGYPLAISRLNIRKRGGDHDSYDIELVVSAYDRNDAPAAAPAPAGSAGDGK